MVDIVRTSDRGAFKRCRLSWDYGSKVRQNLTWMGPAPKPLDFGTAIHRGLEVYYNPETWPVMQASAIGRQGVELHAIAAFHQCQSEQLAGYLKDQPSLGEELRQDYKERFELGEGMLRHYFQWAPRHDNFTPLMTEIEFEVPLERKDTLYQGRIDLVVKSNKSGGLWIIDHKTAAKFDSTEHLELDSQTGSYAWALQQKLGLRIEGVVYSELYKGVPGPPEETYKGTKLSKNKQQATTYDLYLQAVREKFGGIPTEYNDFLDFLKHRDFEYFRRTVVHRSQRELQSIGRDIELEAADMFDDPRIYPNPTKFNCKGCMFRTPCLARQDGSDVDWIIRETYRKRENA